VIVSTMTSMLRSYRKMPESRRRDIQVSRSRLVDRKHELIASIIAGASITIWYDSTVWKCLSTSNVVSRSAGFSESIWIAYVRFERALERASPSGGG
jgi:hypothetical protein